MMMRYVEKLLRGREKQPRVERGSPSPRHLPPDDLVKSSRQEQTVQLRLVNPTCEDETEADADVDIIAIHGLDTKSPDTWTWKDPTDASKPGVNWLEDKHMLPKLVGRARILICDWPSDLFETSELTQEPIEVLARHLLNSIKSRAEENRPILFIASCLGGIVLIKALEMATEEYSSIRTATRSIIFLATPFRGTSFEDVIHWAEPLLRSWASIRNEKVTMLLRNTISTFDLSETVRRFTQLCKGQNYEVSTFYERGFTDLIGKVRVIPKCFRKSPKLLVDHNSATLDIVAHPLSLGRPHILMNKFQGPDKDSDGDYKIVAEKVEYFLEIIREGTLLEQADVWIRDKHYTDERLKIQRLSGDLLPMDRCYINLAIVKQPKERESSSVKYQSSPFSLSSRLKVETPAQGLQIELSNLFDPCGMPSGSTKTPGRILTRGRAGIGKTTLCKKVVGDFIRGKLWKNQFKRVLWVPLRNLKSYKPHNFEELFYHEYFIRHSEGEGHGRKLSRALLQALKSKDERTLFILDGLDEVQDLSSKQNDEYQFFLELLNQPDVIIMTRPHATFPAIFSEPDLELETIGFYPEQVHDYLKYVVKDTNIIQGIKSTLQKHRLLQSLVRIPIQLDALCLVWGDIHKNPIPETMTAIYEAIVLHLWRKDIARLGTSESPECMANTLPSEVEQLSQPENELLECFAFSGMYSNLIEFQSEHQNAIHKLLKPSRQGKFSFYHRLGNLSFLRSPDPLLNESKRSYHFLHLTFQEFFAARYFARKWISNGNLEYLNLNSERPQISSIHPAHFLQQHKYNSRYDIVWRFTIGLLSSESFTVSSFHSESEVRSFFRNLEQEPCDILGPTHQRLVMHCLGEAEICIGSDWRPKMEEKLSQWVLLDLSCRNLLGGYTAAPKFALQSEFPDCALQIALNQVPTSDKMEILKAFLKRGGNLPEVVIKCLSELLKSPDDAIRSTLLEALSTEKPSLSNETFKKLAGLLQDETENENAVYTIVAGLENQSNLSEEVVAKLVRCLQNEKRYIINSAAAVLKNKSNLPEEAITALIELHRKMDIYAPPFDKTKWKIALNINTILVEQSTLTENATATLVALLKESSNYGIPESVEYILGKRPSLSEETVAALVALIENDDNASPHRARSRAIGILSKHKNLSKQTITHLQQVMEEKDRNVRKGVIDILRTQLVLSEEDRTNLETSVQSFTSEKAATDLVQLLEHTDHQIQHNAIGALSELSLSETNVRTLLTQFQCANPTIQRNATQVLSRQPNLSEEAIETLLTQLENKDLEICHGALKILKGQLSLPVEATMALIKQLQSERLKISERVVEVLSKQPELPAEAFTVLITLLGDKRGHVQRGAAKLLSLEGRPEIPETAIPVFIGLLQHADSSIRFSASKLLERRVSGPQSKLEEEIAKVSARLLIDPDYQVKRDVRQVLMERPNLSNNFIEALLQLIPGSDRDVRFDVIRILEMQSHLSREAAKAIVGMLEDEDKFVRRQVLHTIGAQFSLDKISNALASSPLDSRTAELLYRGLLYHGFRDQIWLEINDDASLGIHYPNGSQNIRLDNCNSREDTLAEVVKWRAALDVDGGEL